MTTGKALNGKPYAGNPHVRFDEGEVALAATPRRGSLLNDAKISNAEIRGDSLFALAMTAALFAAVSAPLTSAAGDYDDYVKLTAGDSVNKTSSFDNNVNGGWTKSDVVESEGPHSGEKYYSAKTLCVSNFSAEVSTFGGDELVLYGSKGYLWVTATMSKEAEGDRIVNIPSLTLHNGGYIRYSNNKAAKLEGTCTVIGATTPASRLDSSVNNHKMLCGLDFKGDADAVFEFTCKGATDYASSVRIDGNASEYVGTLLATGTLMNVIIDRPSSYVCGGTMKIANGTVLTIDPDTPSATFGTLSVSNGSSIEMTAYENGTAPIVVTNAIVTGGTKIPISVNFPVAMTASLQKFPLITLKAGASGDLSADDFDVTSSYTVAEGTGLTACPSCLYLRYVVETDSETGDKTLCATHRRIVYLKNEGSAFLDVNKELWSDGETINATNDYYVIDKQIYTIDDIGYVFPGASLTVRYQIRGSSTMTMSISDLRIVGCNGISVYQKNMLTFKDGTITTIKDTVPFQFQCYNGGGGLSSEVRGDGDIAFRGRNNYEDTMNIKYVLSNLNTNFTGNIRAYRVLPFVDSGVGHDPTNECVSIAVSDQRNLGGAKDEFDAEALSLEALSVLDVAGSVTFDEPTRGWSIKGQGRIDVEEGATVTVTNKQITYSGEFMKEGAGLLALGGTAKFTEEQSDTPLAGTNLLSVLEGSLMPLSTNAFDGLAINFAAGTGLVLDAAATGDMKTYGLYDVKWDSPITVAGDAALPVSFRLPPDFNPKKTVTYGICTVSEAAANSIEVADFAVTAPGGMSAQVTKGAAVDGKVTFSCALSRGGFIFIVR